MLKALFLAVTIVLVAVVTVRGRSEERTTAAMLVLASLVSPLVSFRHFHGFEPGVMLVDGLVLAWLLRVALVSDRFWPLWAAGFQLVGVAIHLARLAVPYVWVLAYSNTEIFWAYPVYLAVIVGTLIEARHRQK